MMRILSTLCLGLCTTIGFVACGSDDSSGAQPVSARVELHQDSSGDLAYCTTGSDDASADDAVSTCSTVPNPKGCTTLIITVDTATGKTCEMCAGADGSQISKTCGGRDAQVACQVVTIPDPDCVVCAYVNGTVIYSSCEAKDECANVACPAIARVCPDGQTAEQDPNSCCGTICKPQPCGDVLCAADAFMACPPGTILSHDVPGQCCGSCVPASCTSDNDCPELTHCSVRDGDCNGCAVPNAADGSTSTTPPVCDAVCRGACVADRVICPDILVAAPDSCVGGKYVSAGSDANGCSLGWLCYCPDGSVAKDGNCK